MTSSTPWHSSHVGGIQYNSNRHIRQKRWDDIIPYKRPTMILDRLCYHERRQRFVYRGRPSLYCGINRFRSKLSSINADS